MEPITHSLIAVTKKYISAFAGKVMQLPLDRYHFILVSIENNQEKLTQKALGDILSIDKSYMVNILNHLEEKGYIIREKNINDRREQLIKLTEQAKKDLPLIKDAIKELNQKSLQNLTSKQIEIFNEVLHIIQNNLSDSVPAEIMLEYKKL
ncbi:MAG: MarR family transcriptional regulator [Sphingobacteriales bacterium]|nr:MarR family transcriptional regulator [Sphingobacteriales bacterium]